MYPLPAGNKTIAQEYTDSWRVTMAYYQYDIHYVEYAGMLQWELLQTSEGIEYGAFSWGMLTAIQNYKEIT
jgi:hypothetical protein